MQRLFLTAALASLTVAAPRVAAAADQCTAARVMVVLDKSSSMVTGSIGDQTKWDIAVGGLGQVLSAYESQAEFGLMTFPSPSACGPGALDVEPAKNNRSAILGALTTPPPTAGNYTPMAESLEAAGNEPSLASAAGARHVILITDGWQWCSPYDPATRYDGTPAVETLTAAGITTWVVGFGDEVDAAALNRMAVAANTARPGCNPNSTDAAAPDNCYFQVDNAADLVNALTAIAGSISGEMCDGIDNDCDGQIDEDLVRSCSTACGVGEETCSNGTWGACDAPVSDVEVCDGIDNDCDGDVDEPGPDLCDDGEVCNAGQCQPSNPETGDGDLGAAQAGCCQASGPDVGNLAPFLATALVLFGGSRRRRK